MIMSSWDKSPVFFRPRIQKKLNLQKNINDQRQSIRVKMKVLVKNIIIILFILLAIVVVFLGVLYSPVSNSHLLFKRDGAAIVYDRDQLAGLYKDENVKISKLNFSREGESPLKKVLNIIVPPRLYLFEFKINKYNFSVSLDEKGQTAKQRIGLGDNFSINSAFYDTENRSIGEVIVKARQHGRRTNSSGFFKVINGVAWVGPRSLFYNKRGKVEYSCQAHPSVMKNGVIWHYIKNETNGENFKERTFRNLSGINADGNIVFLVSGEGGLLSVKEISQIALKLNIKTATLFDAGSALQYQFNNKHYRLGFRVYNNDFYLGAKPDELITKIIGRKSFNSSPVFINYKY